MNGREDPGSRAPILRPDLAWYGIVALVYLATTYIVAAGEPHGPDRMMVLAEQMTRGHVDSPTFAGTVDSVQLGGRYYMAVGLLQPLVYLPFVALPALQPIAAYVVNVVIGIAAAWTGLPLARAYGATGSTAYWMASFTAFGTLLFFLSVFGNMYYLAQVESFLALGLFLIEWAGRRRPLVLGSLLGISFLARSTTILAAVPFGLLLVWRHPDWPRRLIAFGVPLVAAVIVLGAYDWARFGSPLETGYGISLLLARSLQARRALGLFSFRQIPENLRLALFTGFTIRGSPPFLIPSRFGLSMLLVSPALVTALWAGLARRARALWAAVALVAIPVFLYYGGGVVQYGYRYSLDFTPFLVALMALGTRRRFGWPERALIVVSIASVAYGVNWLGHHQIL